MMVLYTLQSPQNAAYAHAAVHCSPLQGLLIVAVISRLRHTIKRDGAVFALRGVTLHNLLEQVCPRCYLAVSRMAEVTGMEHSSDWLNNSAPAKPTPEKGLALLGLRGALVAARGRVFGRMNNDARSTTSKCRRKQLATAWPPHGQQLSILLWLSPSHMYNVPLGLGLANDLDRQI
jgi:hypothetical protein